MVTSRDGRFVTEKKHLRVEIAHRGIDMSHSEPYRGNVARIEGRETDMYVTPFQFDDRFKLYDPMCDFVSSTGDDGVFIDQDSNTAIVVSDEHGAERVRAHLELIRGRHGSLSFADLLSHSSV